MRLSKYLPFSETAGVTEANTGSSWRVATWRSLNPDGITRRIATPGATQTYIYACGRLQLHIDSLTNNDRLAYRCRMLRQRPGIKDVAHYG